jgi:nicotinic acid mononucleotide adenylyltransferase
MKKLLKLKQIADFELEEIKEMRRFTPKNENSSALVLLMRKINSNPMTQKHEFLAKLSGIRSTTKREGLEELIVNILRLKKWKHKTEAEKKKKYDMVEKAENDIRRAEYFQWRKKRDYRVSQEQKLQEFLKKKDQNTLFFLCRTILEQIESFLELKTILDLVKIGINIAFTKLCISINDHNNDVAEC